MNERIDAIFENGVFRPEVPVNITNGERVSLDIHRRKASTNDLGDVLDLLDTALVESCRQNAKYAPSLEEVQAVLSAFEGSLADRICQERDER
jgi:predicted DNA-binding antitoxin AbrB/MazE fold protein